MKAVTFDFGNTLADIDYELLACRVGERGASLDATRARRAAPSAWEVYGRAKRSGAEGQAAWTAFMRALLEGSDLRGGEPDALARWLFGEQPNHNLWRRPIAGMVELCSELKERAVPLAIVSNSEGKLAELLHELGWANLFRIIADSGRLGFEKPDPRIFRFVAFELGVAVEDIVHVGDAWATDIEGARSAGARAIWFGGGGGQALDAGHALPEGIVRCMDAAAVRDALRAFFVW